MATMQMNEDFVIRLLCKEGRLDKAIIVLFHMKTSPATNTYISLLKACNKSRDSYQAKQVHVHLVKHIQHFSGYLGDYLVMTLARCGAIQDALETSRTLPHCTIFSWTAMLSAYAERGQGREALELYECMKKDGVEPNHYTFVALLKACGSVADLEKVRTLHNDVRRMGLGDDVYISTTLVSVYGKCGSIEDAENVFRVLIRRDVVTWNAMLTAYIEQGFASKVLKLFRQIQEERVSLDELMFVSALQACTILAEEGGSRKSMALEVGMALHANAQQAGFCAGPFILTTLINMYSKSGNIKGAEDVISGAWSQCNSVTLNAMIAAYFEHNQERKSLQLYTFMQERFMNVDEYTFASVLQACGAVAQEEEVIDVGGESLKVMSLNLIKALHADAEKWNFLSDVFVCNTLIRIYGRCGAIGDAEGLFCKLYYRDIISWNSLLSAYVEHGHGEKALLLYKQMREERLSPGQLTYAMVLQACGQLAERENWAALDREQIKLMSLEIGLGLHADVEDQNFAADVVVGDSLLRMYSKCGAIMHAENVFTAIYSQLDVRFWTAMLLAYVEHDYEEKALQLYVQIHKEGMSPDQHTFVAAIHACGILAEKEEGISSNGRFIKEMSLEIGAAIHADARRQCFTSDIFINNTLISMYGRCGAFAQAQNLFTVMVDKNEVSWNALLSACAAHSEKPEKVLQLYRQMQVQNSSVGQATYVIALQACRNLLQGKVEASETHDKACPLEIGRAIYFDAQKSGFSSDVAINNSLISMYGKIGNLQEAEAVFGAMHQRDGVSWTVLLSMYVEQGEIEKILEVYSQMPVKNILLDDVSLVYVLRACHDLGSLDICRWHHFAMSSHVLDLTPSLAVSLIHTYGSCASSADAQASFDGICRPDISSWNACIACYAGEGDCKFTIHTLEELYLAGKERNEVSFISALNACVHAGLPDLGLENFMNMTRESETNPGLMHYSILVDLLGRSGCFRKVESMLKRMSIQPDVTMWISLLGCCRTHGNLEVGERAFNRAVSLQPGHRGAYVMLSNLYIEAGLLKSKEASQNSLEILF
ncbi:hypothetical protein L7F22_029387 [Adiantum nelumboides]|nr:hypothetical protein [Adiantum nelumboides]